MQSHSPFSYHYMSFWKLPLQPSCKLSLRNNPNSGKKFCIPQHQLWSEPKHGTQPHHINLCHAKCDGQTVTLKNCRYIHGLTTGLKAQQTPKKCIEKRQKLSASRLFKLFLIALYPDCGISTLFMGNLLVLLVGNTRPPHLPRVRAHGYSGTHKRLKLIKLFQ